MARTRITTNMLQKMAQEHISYEIEMFVQSFQKLLRGNLNQYENNSAIETLLIHARCLFDFLYPPSNMQNDDVIADDFFNDVTAFRILLPQSLPIANYLKRRAGKEIAHLTYERLNVTLAQKVWNFKEIHDQINNALAIFFENLSDEQRGWFRVTVVRS